MGMSHLKKNKKTPYYIISRVSLKLCLEIQVLLIYIKWKINFDRSFVMFVESDVSNAQHPYEFLTDVD